MKESALVGGRCSALIEATVFEDSDLRRLFMMLPHVSETLKNIAGYTFHIKPSQGTVRAQVFVDRVCEAVWEIKQNKWRYNNRSKRLAFKQDLKPSDLRRFLMAYEYSVLHELLHDLHDGVLTQEEPVHSAATALLMTKP